MEESVFEGQDPGDRAHDLYWSSDRSVNSIAEELGLSKGGLYQHILPLPAPGSCPRCGGAVGYFNRTARDRNEPTCLALCDHEAPFAAAASPGRQSGVPSGESASRDEVAGEDRSAEDAPPPPGRLRAPLSDAERRIVAGVLLAGAAGLLFLRLSRR